MEIVQQQGLRQEGLCQEEHLQDSGKRLRKSRYRNVRSVGSRNDEVQHEWQTQTRNLDSKRIGGARKVTLAFPSLFTYDKVLYMCVTAYDLPRKYKVFIRHASRFLSSSLNLTSSPLLESRNQPDNAARLNSLESFQQSCAGMGTA